MTDLESAAMAYALAEQEWCNVEPEDRKSEDLYFRYDLARDTLIQAARDYWARQGGE